MIRTHMIASLVPLGMVMIALDLCAQTTASPPRWYESIDVNAFLSGSYSCNFGRPDDGKNRLRIFDMVDNSFSVDVLELSVKRDAMTPGEAGFRFDLTAGSSIPRVVRSGGMDIGDLDFHQMYLTYLIPAGKGLRVDFGKFITLLGYEVIEGYDGFNDNGSHSFLFGYAIPFTHTGMRFGYTFSDQVSASIMMVNGWDNSVDNNRAKTFSGQCAVKPAEGLSLMLSGICGPEEAGDNADTRVVLDLAGAAALSSAVLVGFNADYGREQRAAPGGGDAIWKGVAGYWRWNFLEEFSVSLRAEQFEDRNGVRTGAAQKLRECTITPEFRPSRHLVLRCDLRFDRSDSDVFMRGSSPSNTQATLGLNVVCFY